MAAIRDRVADRGGRGEHRPCGRRLAATLLLIAPLLAPPQATAASAVDVAAVVGFADTFHPGRWAPLNVTVANHGGDVIGELEVQVTAGDDLQGRLFVTTYRRTLELHRNSRKSFQFTVLPQLLSYPLVIRASSGGRELARSEIDLRTRFVAERLLLALSPNAVLDYMNDGTANGLRVLYPHPELLPVHWRGYDAVASVVLHEMSLERLSASQYDAMRKWIAQGGTLAVSGGPDYALLQHPRIAALLPGTPLGMTRVDAGALTNALSASLDATRPVHVHRLGAFRGRVRLSAGGVPLIVERGFGRGRVLYLTFDVAGYPFDRWTGMRELLRNTLRLPEAAASGPGVAEPGIDSPIPALVRAEAKEFPSRATAFSFLALYLGLLLAGCGIPVRESRLRWLAPLGRWAAPVLFAAAAWLMFGPTVFPREPAAVAVAMIEPFPGSNFARLELDLGLYSSRSGALRMEYGGAEPVLHPPREAQRSGTADWVLGEDSRRYLAPRDRRRYVLHALEGEDVIVFRFDASVHEESAGLRVNLDNASGQAVEDLWLIFDGYAYSLGSIADGVRMERGFTRRAHGVEVGAASWRPVLRAPSGVPAQDLAPARIALERRSQKLGGAGYPRPGHALLIGYSESPVQPAGASAGWPRRERTLVAFQVAVAAQ